MTQPLAPAFEQRIPEGDDRTRRVCAHCDFVDYQNPRIVAGSVVYSGNRVLLCRRAIEPWRGYWTLPAGYMEMGETVQEAACREAREEACAELSVRAMLAVYDIPRIAQVQVMFLADLVSDIAPGPESEAVDLFDWADIPWADLAFPSVVWALTQSAEVRARASFVPFSNPAGTDALVR